MSKFGMEGFRWWVGDVIDARNDPLRLGRVRVRIFGVDDEKTDDEIVYWASCLLPTTSASYRQIGDTPNLVEGSQVFGFFADGERGQVRIVVGSFPQQPDDENTNALAFEARGKNPVALDKIHPVEPDSAYTTEYPFNRVIRTRKGHKIELDDTDDGERVLIHHAGGTLIEMAPDGRLTVRNPGDSFEIVGGVKNVAIKGNANIDVGGNVNVVAKGDINLASERDITIKSKGVLRLFGLVGVQLATGGDVSVQGPGGLSVTDGSLIVAGRISSGSGLTATLIAGGKNITFRDGIAVRSSR